jgi:preprotein translocase subunit SecA
MFDQQSDALYGQITTLLQSHLGAYDALYTLLTTLQAADMTQQQRSEQALQLREVFTLLSDYGATTEVCIDTFQSITSQPPGQWEETTHKLVVAATFHASHELSTQEIIDRIAKNAPGIFFAGDAQQLQNSYDDLMATYQKPSAVLQQASSPEPEEGKEPEEDEEDTEATLHKAEAQQPIAHWSAEIITRWAQLVKEQYVQVAQSELLAVIQRAVALHHGFAPRSTQLLSVLALLNTPENMGRLAQINTGEGKSLIVAMLAAIHALQGQKVDVLTTSTELSIPEINKQTPFFTTLGLTVGENSKKNATDDEARHAIYQKDIVYGTAEDFQADIISAEFFRRNIRGHRGFGVVLVDEVDSMLFDDRNYSTRLSSLTPAMNHLEMIYGTLWWFVNLLTSRLRTIDGQYYFIDFKVEFEDIIGGGVKLPEGKALSDCALPVEDPIAFFKERATGLYSSFVRQLTQEEQKDREEHKAQELRIEELNKGIQELENKLENASPHWLLLHGEKKKNELERLKAEQKAAVEALKHSAWSKVLQERPYVEVPVHLRAFASKQMPNWIESAIYALLCYQKDQHYHVKGGKIVPIDYSNTGVLQYNTVWNNGLAQFLQMKEGLKVTPESIATNFISKPGYFKRYEHRLYGLTGTLGNATTRSFLQEMYGVDMVTIPPYKYREILGNDASRYLCKELLPRLVPTSAAWYDAVTESVLRPARNGQAVLVICNYISQVHHLRERLAANYNTSKLFAYTGEQDFKQHQVDTGEIILATNIAGRGTDLTTSAAVEEKGGLHVCITFLPASYRVELQNAGRTARQGKKGSAQLVLRTSGAETLQALRTQRDEKEAQGIARAREDVAKMLSSDRLFMRYCGVEASFFPTMEAVAKMQLSQYLLARWQVYAEVALSSEAVEALYEEAVQRHAQTTRQQNPEPDSWQDYTEEALLEARNTQLKHIQAVYREKYPLAVFRKEYEAQQREAFLQEQQAHQDIPADVLVSFLEGRAYVPSGSELVSQYGWEESERHGSQERWGIWLKEDSTENDMESAARHRRFDGLEKELKDDAQRDKLIQNPYYYVQKGNELLRRGLYRLAVKSCDRAIALDPLYSVNARFNKARALVSPKENKSNHREAKNELQEAQRLIGEQKSALLSFDALVGQTGKKPRTSEHVQHQLDILSQQENYIQAAIDVIERAREKDWDVEITEIKSIKEVLEKAEGNRTQALEEAAVNGFAHVFTIKEKQPKSWWSIVAVALIGLAQIVLSVLCTTVGLVNLASNFVQQGISDLMAAFKAAKGGGYFSWKEWGIQRAISMAVAFIGAGVKMLKQWVSDKIVPNLNKGIQKFAGKVQAITNRFKVGFSADDASQSRTLLKEVGTRLAGGIVKDLVQTLVNDGLDKLLVEHISASVEKAVTKKIIEALEQNTLVQAAIALDVKNNSNHWQNILQQEGLAILHDPGSEFGRACKEVLKGVITNEVLDQLGENKEGSIGKQLVKEFIQTAPQIAEATHKALTLTGKFLKKFEKEIQDKHKKSIEKAQKEQQQREEEEKQQQETVQQQSQEAVQAVSAPPPVSEEDIGIPQIAFNKDYKGDLRQYYYEAPSSAGNLYSTFSSHLTSQITNHIQGGIIHPLASIGVNMTVDRMLAGVHKSIEEEKKRYQEGAGGQRDKVNAVSNRLTPEGGTTEEKAQEAHQQAAQPNEGATETQHTPPSQPTTENTSVEELARQCKEGKFGLTQAAILAAMTNRPVAVKENGKLVKIIGNEKPGKIIVIDLERSANQESGHWTGSVSKKDQRKAQSMTAKAQKMIAKAQNAIEKHGDSQKAQIKIAAGEKMLAEAQKLSTPMVVNSGVDNCGYDASAFQIDGVSSGAELREQLVRYITHANPSLATELYDTQKQIASTNPGVLMYGGNVGMALLYVQHNDPNSTYNQGRLAASDPQYAALREALKSARASGNQAQVEALATKCREMEVAAFEARRERERQQIRNFVEHAYLFSGGLGNALGNNLSLGAIPRRHLHHPAFSSGQRVGDGLSIGLGATEFFVGKGMMGSGGLVLVASGGTLFPVAAPLSTIGVAVSSHGVVVIGKALLEFSKVKAGQYVDKKHNSRNEKHTNRDTKNSARREYERIRINFKALKSKPSKTAADIQELKKLEKQMKHWKSKSDFSGETHHRN